jgi:hypothetical protein
MKHSNFHQLTSIMLNELNKEITRLEDENSSIADQLCKLFILNDAIGKNVDMVREITQLRGDILRNISSIKVLNIRKNKLDEYIKSHNEVGDKLIDELMNEFN